MITAKEVILTIDVGDGTDVEVTSAGPRSAEAAAQILHAFRTRREFTFSPGGAVGIYNADDTEEIRAKIAGGAS